MTQLPPPPRGRFAQLPVALRERSRTTRLGEDVPALVCSPIVDRPPPAVIWMHGRTVYKELDPGRYLRWIRRGIAAIALDLPGHGERVDPDRQTPRGTPGVLEQMLGELDGVLDDITHGQLAGIVDPERIAIGGMSAGGMVTLRRLCDPHPFVGGAVESTCGQLSKLYLPRSHHPQAHRDDDTSNLIRNWPAAHDPAQVQRLDASQHLGTWRPIPMLALHSEADQMVPWTLQRGFLDKLRARYAELGEDPARIEAVTWPTTGAPAEHAGFGKVAGDAKECQVEFLVRLLVPDPMN